MVIHKCVQPGCSIEEDNKCLEGHLDFSTCPFYNLEKNEGIVDVEVEYEDEQKNNEEFIDVHQGDVLSLYQAEEIAKRGITRLVMLAGLPESGKTTLLASLMQLFQQNKSFANFRFFGSKTLIGLEKRCHKSRITSEGISEETERTKLISTDLPPEFLHLSLSNSTLKTYNLLFTDISGEHFRILANSTEECRKFTLVNRCDHFALLLDADLLSDINHRNLVKITSINILRSLKDAGMINTNTHIQVIFSRWDLLQKKDNINGHREFIDCIKFDIRNKYFADNDRVTFHEVASRPTTNSELVFGHGLEEILSLWVERSQFIKTIPTNLSIDTSNLNCRQFSKFEISNNGK